MLRALPERAVGFAAEPETFFFAEGPFADAALEAADLGEFFVAEGFADAVLVLEAVGFFFAVPLD